MTDKETPTIPSIGPLLIKRACGGWLAVAPDGAEFRIGATAQTESEAREKFLATLDRWGEILSAERVRAEAEAHR